jgi:Lipid A 3-O-deacylase (PagL)
VGNLRWWGGWLGAVLLGFGIQPASVSSAEEGFRFGTTELNIAGGYSVSHTTVDNQAGQVVHSFQALPHFGVFLTDEHGPSWLRGNFELLAEPTVVTFRAKPDSATAVGFAALGRWVFGARWVVRPYFELGLGVLNGQFDIRQTNCDVNFIIEGGPGFLWLVSERVAITAGYRVQHISNASRCDQNVGINSSLFMLGVSHFFP